MEKGRIEKLRSYWHRSYYSNGIPWLLMDKDERSVSCDRCGNIANGIMVVKRQIGIFNIPLCKKHISEIAPSIEFVPCRFEYKKPKRVVESIS